MCRRELFTKEDERHAECASSAKIRASPCRAPLDDITSAEWALERGLLSGFGRSLLINDIEVSIERDLPVYLGPVDIETFDDCRFAFAYQGQGLRLSYLLAKDLKRH